MNLAPNAANLGVAARFRPVQEAATSHPHLPRRGGSARLSNTAPARGPLWRAQTDGPCAEISVEPGTPARPTRRPRLTQTRGSRAELPRFVDGKASVASTAREQLVHLLVTWLMSSNQKRRFLLSPIRVGGAPRDIRGATERADAHLLDCEAQRRLMSDSATASSAPCSMNNVSCGAGPLVGRGEQKKGRKCQN